MAKGLLNQAYVASLGQQFMGQAVPEAVWRDSLLDTRLPLPLVKPSAELASGNSPAGGAYEQCG